MAYWALSNCVSSDADAVLPLLSMGFLSGVVKVGESTFNDAVAFLATALLFCAVGDVSGLASQTAIDFLVRGLNLDEPPVTLKCLNAIGRLFLLGLTNDQLSFTLDMVKASAALPERLEMLKQASDEFIQSKAIILSDEIRKNREAQQAEP
jgi:hypothetical protein